MDRLTPAPSFRPTRPLRRTCNASPPPRRNQDSSPLPRRTCNPSPPLRTAARSSLPEPIFIATDSDHWHAFHHMPPSSPDSDLIFQMSPVPSHSDTPSLSRFSPLLYSFPHMSNAHESSKGQARDSASSKNVHTPTSVWSPPVFASPPVNTSVSRPLAASFLGSDHSQRLDVPKNPTFPNNRAHPHTPSPSSPIPIPRPQSRAWDPRPPPPLFSSPGDHVNPALHSPRYCKHSPPARPHAHIEGFANESDDDSGTDSHISTTPSTAYSSAGSGPFRLTKFLHDAPR